MNNRKCSARILVRYTLLQLPALALLILILILVQQWVDLPTWIFWGSIVVWIAKDAILYPFVWRAYDRDLPQGTNTMVGVRGIAKGRLAPSGYVQIRGELWNAEVMEGNPPIEKGEDVRVRSVRGLTLIVQPCTIENER
jgi:membrane protein implicated in regulation of membrane protease activity